jgi:hypothetical protein
VIFTALETVGHAQYDRFSGRNRYADERPERQGFRGRRKMVFRELFPVGEVSSYKFAAEP